MSIKTRSLTPGVVTPLRSFKSVLSTAALLGLTATLAAGSADAALLAGFYDSETDAIVASLAANTTATDIAATFDGRGRQTTSNIGSTDGNYGSTALGAPTALPTEAPFAAVYRSNVDNTFTITNNSTSNVSVETIAFDFHNNDNPSRDYFDILNLIYLSGDLSDIVDNTTLNTWNSIPRHTGTISLNGDDWEDFDFSLTSLSDYTLAPGQSASFRISSASTDTPLANNQNFGALDNIGFFGTVVPVPEPSSISLTLLGIVGLLIARRRLS